MICLRKRRREKIKRTKTEEKHRSLTNRELSPSSSRSTMDRTPMHDPSMTPSASAMPGGGPGSSSAGAGQAASKTMIYVCGECRKDNELKSTDVIRCKKRARNEMDVPLLSSRQRVWLPHPVQEANKTIDRLRCEIVAVVLFILFLCTESNQRKIVHLVSSRPRDQSVSK